LGYFRRRAPPVITTRLTDAGFSDPDIQRISTNRILEQAVDNILREFSTTQTAADPTTVQKHEELEAAIQPLEPDPDILIVDDAPAMYPDPATNSSGDSLLPFPRVEDIARRADCLAPTRIRMRKKHTKKESTKPIPTDANSVATYQTYGPSNQYSMAMYQPHSHHSAISDQTPSPYTPTFLSGSNINIPTPCPQEPSTAYANVVGRHASDSLHFIPGAQNQPHFNYSQGGLEFPFSTYATQKPGSEALVWDESIAEVDSGPVPEQCPPMFGNASYSR
jgi:hypothetical protein